MKYQNNAKAGSSMDPDELAYEPDQNNEATRQIRHRYREELDKVEKENNINEISTESMIKTVEMADELFELVKGTGEATLDSRLLVETSQKQVQKARAMKAGSGAFDIDEFVSELILFMGGRGVHMEEDDDDYEDNAEEMTGASLDWEKLGRKALAKSHRVPAMDFMLGPLSIEQKKRNVGKRAKLEKNKDDEKKPQEITEDDITRSENETTKNVANLEKLLEQQGQAINLFRFIINPRDFGQSVENLFYLSFLIRDGKCALQIGEEGEPEIYLSEQPSEQDYTAGLRKQQIVMEFDMATWRRAIEVFNITDSIIPQRPKAETRIGSKWYG